ncbi:MAG TPA: type 4a pilus biogenesis protein PilO [Candidatus Omnitrophota bacterium]|nr:type 4a pilus biogenesis protein PilO [Candidatus Omnitrophota bacterium]
MKLKLSERERWLLFATAVFAVFYLFMTFLYGPKASENDSLKEKLRSQQLELKTSLDKAKILQSMELTPLEKLRSQKTKEEQVIDALQYISKEVGKVKLNMKYIRPRLEERVVDSAKAVFIDLTFTGRYNEIYKFMSALEKLPILILVDSMDMIRGEDADITVNMVLSVYY